MRGEVRARPALNGERGALRSRRSIPIHTYPEGTLGMVDGWATRTGQRGGALAVRPESGVGGGVYINIIYIDITFPRRR